MHIYDDIYTKAVYPIIQMEGLAFLQVSKMEGAITTKVSFKFEKSEEFLEMHYCLDLKPSTDFSKYTATIHVSGHLPTTQNVKEEIQNADSSIIDSFVDIIKKTVEEVAKGYTPNTVVKEAYLFAIMYNGVLPDIKNGKDFILVTEPITSKISVAYAYGESKLVRGELADEDTLVLEELKRNKGVKQTVNLTGEYLETIKAIYNFIKD